MRTPPLVSVLITVYNGMPLLRKVIDHLLNQTYKDFEIIVVDDASSDDSVAII
jgi:glycosyltransferase involved in cell wall biosynthesis